MRLIAVKFLNRNSQSASFHDVGLMPKQSCYILHCLCAHDQCLDGVQCCVFLFVQHLAYVMKNKLIHKSTYT